MAQRQSEIYAKQFASFLAIGNMRNNQESSVKCQFFYPDMPQDEECISNPNKSTNE